MGQMGLSEKGGGGSKLGTCVCGKVWGQRSQVARMGGLRHTAPHRWGKPLDAE